MSDMLRVTGMFSGMDTDSTVKKLVAKEQADISQAEQDKIFLEWQREDYREVSNSLRTFQSSFLDVLSPETNIRSTTAFDMFSGTAKSGGVETSAVSIKTTAKSVKGSFTINSVNKLATKDLYESSVEVKGDINTGIMNSIANINTAIDADNTLSFTFDGTTKIIELDQNDYASYDAFATDVSLKLQAEFTNVEIFAEVVNGNSLEFNIYEQDTTKQNIIDGVANEEVGHSLTINSDNDNLLTQMNIKAGTSNTVNMSGTLADVFNKSDDTELTINGVDFTFTTDTKISDVINEINSSAANVILRYDTMTDKFALESSLVGSDNTITITDTDTLLEDFKLQGGFETHTAASNAEFTVNNVLTTRSSNTFEINGTEVTLNSIPSGEIDVTVESDTKNVKDLIINFVSAYNELIEGIDKKTSEVKNYNFTPLTVKQKDEMTESEIETWETQARLGTLSNDNTLNRLTSELRNALYSSVEGLGISLYDIGIQTSNNYTERGKLTVNMTKLESALEDRPNEVIALFTQESDTDYTDFSDRQTRRSENGLAERLSDIIKDNIRVTRDDNGQKGYLINKAGSDTGIDTSSYLAKKIIAMDDKIDDLLDMLTYQETKFYNQFAAMESALAEMESQGAWLSSQLG